MKGKAGEALGGRARAAKPSATRRRPRAAARVSRYGEAEARREGTALVDRLGRDRELAASSGLPVDRVTQASCCAGPFFFADQERRLLGFLCCLRPTRRSRSRSTHVMQPIEQIGLVSS